MRLLNLSEATVKRIVGRGDLQSIKVGDRRMIPTEALDEYIERLKAAS